MTTIIDALAWGRTIVQYNTTAPIPHTFSFHHKELDPAGTWAVPHAGETTIYDTLDALISVFSPFIPAGAAFGKFQTYKNHPSPIPTEFWMIGDCPTPTDAPANTVRNAGEITFTLRTPTNHRVQFVWFDGAGEVPFFKPAADFNAAEQDVLDYLILHGNITSKHGEVLKLGYGFNNTINRTMSRRYGKALTP
jgi:hypothetical protein